MTTKWKFMTGTYKLELQGDWTILLFVDMLASKA